jgi:hypothetical protein
VEVVSAVGRTVRVASLSDWKFEGNTTRTTVAVVFDAATRSTRCC